MIIFAGLAHRWFGQQVPPWGIFTTAMNRTARPQTVSKQLSRTGGVLYGIMTWMQTSHLPLIGLKNPVRSSVRKLNNDTTIRTAKLSCSLGSIRMYMSTFLWYMTNRRIYMLKKCIPVFLVSVGFKSKFLWYHTIYSYPCIGIIHSLSPLWQYSRKTNKRNQKWPYSR